MSTRTRGRMIRNAREDQYARQPEAAKAIGISTRALSMAETGARIGHRVRTRIEDFFGWSRGSIEAMDDEDNWVGAPPDVDDSDSDLTARALELALAFDGGDTDLFRQLWKEARDDFPRQIDKIEAIVFQKQREHQERETG